jgi:NTE family protein
MASENPDQPMNKIGLVLSGGGVRGIAHLGVIQALSEMKIKPDMISGTSAGAIVGAFIAAGYEPWEVMDIARHSDLFGAGNIVFGKPGVFSMKSFGKIYSQYFSRNSFEDLRLPLFVTATDIVNGESVTFSSGNLAEVLMASSCVPVVFEPVKINGSSFVDGGVLNNFPVEPLLSRCTSIIGVHVNSINAVNPDISMISLADRSFHLALSSSVKSKTHCCNLFIEPENMTRFGMFDTKKMDDIFDAGYHHVMNMRTEVEEFRYSVA